VKAFAPEQNPVLSHRHKTVRLTLELGDGLIAALCLIAAAGIRCSDALTGMSFLGPVSLGDDLYISAAMAGLASSGALHWTGAYDGHRELSRVLGKLAGGSACAALGLLGAGLAFGLEPLCLSLVALYAAASLAGLAAWRLVASSWLGTSRTSHRNQQTFIMIGSDPQARRVAACLTADWGSRNLGFLDDEPRSLDVETIGELFLGSAKELGKFLENEIVDEVIIALPRQRLASDSTTQAIRLCEAVGLDVTIVSDLFQAQRAKPSYHEVLGVPALNFVSYQPRQPLALAVKRAMDVLGAALGLVLTLPLWLVVAAAIKLDSRGPIFFVQDRCGLHGRTFPFLKFRTMSCDAERRRAELLQYNEVSAPVFKIAHDPRVTRVGRFLRRSSIDELPQLINVLLGHMSLVGPRPPIPEEVNAYELAERRRLSVRPGLTCLWQISGRSLLRFEDWVRLDLQYIDQWSLLLDLRIMLRTIPAVLTAKGAS
jgi:exopolysaccharide biosynthesis polyprenyl glycosylphosphotransferase